MKNKRIFLLGMGITCIYFLVHLLIINDYGISWDFHYHHFAGLYHLGLPVPSINDPSPVPFTPPDPRLTTEDPFGPFTQIVPTLSYLLLYQKWKLLPFDAAYNFPMIIFGSLGVGLLFIFASEASGLPAGILSALFLGLLPVHFAYLHTSMKDTANAFAFTLSIYLFWKLVTNPRLRNLILASMTFAFAFNVKVNSILIPVVCLIWFIWRNYPDIIRLFTNNFKMIFRKKIFLPVLYFFVSPILAIILWWPFWRNPLAKLLELPYFYSHNTLNMPVLFLGQIFHSGINIPWYYPFVYLGITTPLPILMFFILGLIICLKRIKEGDKAYMLFILWFFIPLLRYLSPKSGAIDGVRHFLEIVYPLCLIAGIGAMEIYNLIIKKNPRPRLTGIVFGTVISFSLLVNIVKSHPYQTSFFNTVAGGIKGAWGKFDIDFWGTPQKEAMLWLNKNASNGSYIHVVMAQSSAAVYLRPDLINNLNRKNYWESDYTVVLNRESFFTIYNVMNYIENKTNEEKMVFQRQIDGVPLVWIFKK